MPAIKLECAPFRMHWFTSNPSCAEAITLRQTFTQARKWQEKEKIEAKKEAVLMPY